MKFGPFETTSWRNLLLFPAAFLLLPNDAVIVSEMGMGSLLSRKGGEGSIERGGERARLESGQRDISEASLPGEKREELLRRNNSRMQKVSVCLSVGPEGIHFNVFYPPSTTRLALDRDFFASKKVSTFLFYPPFFFQGENE